MTPSISMRLSAAEHARTLLAVLVVLVAAILTLVWAATPPAYAQSSAEGSDGQVLTATQSEGLDPEGTAVTVTGSGYDESKGIYVAVCVDNGAGERPTPCIGGVDMTGEAGESGWISSNPPSYGKGLAEPFGPGGSFEVDVVIEAADDTTDCLDPTDAPDGCVLATYADHTRLQDRSADVRIPLNFAEPGSVPSEATPTDSASEEPTTSQASQSPTAEPTTDPTSEASSSEATVTDEKPSGTPPEFWLWISLAAVALIAAVIVIQSRARKVRAREADQTPMDGGGTDE